MAEQSKCVDVVGYTTPAKFTQGESGARLSFGVAVNYKFQTDGKDDGHAEFTQCELYGKRAEALHESGVFATSAYVRVYGDTRAYRSKNTKTGEITVQLVHRVLKLDLLDSKESAASRANKSTSVPARTSAPETAGA